jgi:hypothetical protein
MFNKFYIGGFTGQNGATSVPTMYLPVPRTFMATLSLAY